MDIGQVILLAFFVWLAWMAFKRFIGGKNNKVQAAASIVAERTAHQQQTSYDALSVVRHWEDEGDETEVVGESQYRETIAQIAGNTNGQHADKACVALLVPEDNNPHDETAVAVVIEGKHVGFLSRADAFVFRDRLADAGIPDAVTSCNARIRWGGLGSHGKQLDYSITLDLSVFPE